MKLRLHSRWLLALLLSLGSVAVAHASHQEGGDITYASIASTTAGVPRYHVVVRQFINVFAVPTTPIASSVALTASRAGCSSTAPNGFTVQAPLVRTIDGPRLACFSPPRMYVVTFYEIDIDLPAGQWILGSSTRYRAADLVNITNPSSQDTFLSTYLDNTVVSQDNSPRFESVVSPRLVSGVQLPYSASAFDLDGDSLSYDLVLPYTSCNQPVTGTVAPHFTAVPGTGHLLPGAPTNIQGYYNLTVRVREYRKVAASWLLIGYVIRDINYFVYATNFNQPPTFSNTVVRTTGGAALAGYAPIAVQPGQTASILLSATDLDAGQTLRFTSEATNIVPGLSLTPLSSQPNTVRLTWQVPATLPPGRYAIPVAVFDDGCPYNMSSEETIVFVVGGATPLAARPGGYAATEVYPTPFREQVQFRVSPSQAVVLFDALGREVARLTSAPDGLVRWQPAPTLPAGLYVARSAEGQPLARLLRAE